MNNAVMLVRDRPNLTHQAISSFLANSKLEWTLTIIDDASSFATQAVLKSFCRKPMIHCIRMETPVQVVGRLKNLGIYWSERQFGRGDYLYVSDNDGFFTEGWDEKLVRVFNANKDSFKLVGPYRHPYHHPDILKSMSAYEIDGGKQKLVATLASTDAVQGLGHLMEWSTWDKYGPYEARAKGTNQSEDYQFCRKIVEDGFLVGSIEPEVVYNCGLKDTNGKPCVGIEVMKRYEGVVME